MKTSVIRRGFVGSALFLAVVVAGCASPPPPSLQQDVQELREQVVELEAGIGESQAATVSTLLMDQIMTRMSTSGSVSTR